MTSVSVGMQLWHISPKFDGDIRHHPGRCYAHTRSEKEYDAEMARHWLSLEPLPDLYQFLRRSFRQLHQEYGSIHGVRVPRN